MTSLKIIVIVLFLLLTFGCSGSKTGQGDKSLNNIYVGKEGLSMEFLPNMPNEKIYSSGGVHIGLRLENKGAYDIENGLISIVGYDTILIQNIEPVTSTGSYINLYGKSLDFPQGQYDLKEFKSLQISFPENTNFLTAPFKVIACYPYETNAFIPVCILTLNYDKALGKEVCKITGYSSGSGQGAPIAVTKIEQAMIPEDSGNMLRAQFTIHIQNIGKGESIEQSKYDASCSPSEEVLKDDLNVVYAKVYLADKDITNNCEPKDQLAGGQIKIKLLDKSNFFVCFDTINKDKPTYQSMLKVVLDYGYFQSIEKKVEIVKS